jgi:hypothetical protein
MSHIVTIETRVHDINGIRAACERLGLSQPEQGTTKLFSGEVSGVLVKLPDWLYPIVIDTLSGLVRYDNYNGAWGKQTELDRFLQAYAVERAKSEARIMRTST